MSFFIKGVRQCAQSGSAVNGASKATTSCRITITTSVSPWERSAGLIVPVIRDADRKTFAEIERDLADYAARAREGKIKIEDLSGGVFTISNGGIYGSLLSTPILNPPQSGILACTKFRRRPDRRERAGRGPSDDVSRAQL
jgi:2-oxoglutarate dehydrogenase E2 component (dihydrolipoamide succinyltransferase)